MEQKTRAHRKRGGAFAGGGCQNRRIHEEVAVLVQEIAAGFDDLVTDADYFEDRLGELFAD